jgi:hypothetical protein
MKKAFGTIILGADVASLKHSNDLWPCFVSYTPGVGKDGRS